MGRNQITNEVFSPRKSSKKRMELLWKVTERIEDDNTQVIQFVYADFNGNIKIRVNEIFRERHYQ